MILLGRVDLIDLVEIGFLHSGLQGTRFEKILSSLGPADHFGVVPTLENQSKDVVSVANAVSQTNSRALVILAAEMRSLCSYYGSSFRAPKAPESLKIPFPTTEMSERPSGTSFLDHEPSAGALQSQIELKRHNDTSTVPLFRKFSFSGAPTSSRGLSRALSVVSVGPADLLPPSPPGCFEAPPAKRRRLLGDFLAPSEAPAKRRVLSFELFGAQTAPRRVSYVNYSLRLRTELAGRRRLLLLGYRPVLPDLVLVRIFSLCGVRTAMRLQRVCRQWRRLLRLLENLFARLDLTPYRTLLSDEAAVQIADFVGPRVRFLDVSGCYHITDRGFSYLVSEIGINGRLEIVRMQLLWQLNSMAIMDVSAPSVGSSLVRLDFLNVKRMKDDVLERMATNCPNLRSLDMSFCKSLTDRCMPWLALMSDRLVRLNMKRCTGISDKGFQHWAYTKFIRLRHLVLADCTFLTQSLISVLSLCAPMLEYLDLSFCCALDDGSLDFLRLGCRHLRDLRLLFCGNAVSDGLLLSLLLGLVCLQRLDIKGCIRVTRAGVDILLSGQCPLRYLDISQCRYAHVYPGGASAVQLPEKNGRSFITTGEGRGIVEIVL